MISKSASRAANQSASIDGLSEPTCARQVLSSTGFDRGPARQFHRNVGGRGVHPHRGSVPPVEPEGLAVADVAGNGGEHLGRDGRAGTFKAAVAP